MCCIISVSQENEVADVCNDMEQTCSLSEKNGTSCDTTSCETSSSSKSVGEFPHKPKSGVLQKFNMVFKRIFSLKV